MQFVGNHSDGDFFWGSVASVLLNSFNYPGESMKLLMDFVDSSVEW